MECVAEGNQGLPAGRDPCDLDAIFHGLGAHGEEGALGRSLEGRELGQALGQSEV